MDQIDINQAANKAMKRLAESGKIGKSTAGMVLTWDGDKSNETDLGDGLFGVKIADYTDLTKVDSITMEVIGFETTTIQKSQFTAAVNNPTGDILVGTIVADSIPILLAISAEYEDFKPGTYAVTTGTQIRFISATIPETIHPIDPKYLPGVCLPVVELSTAIPIDGTEVEFSTDESAKLTNAANLELPVCVKTHLKAGEEKITTSFVTTFAGIAPDISLAIVFNGMLLQIKCVDDVWSAKYGE